MRFYQTTTKIRCNDRTQWAAISERVNKRQLDIPLRIAIAMSHEERLL